MKKQVWTLENYATRESICDALEAAGIAYSTPNGSSIAVVVDNAAAAATLTSLAREYQAAVDAAPYETETRS